jgi:two-component system, NtrC family, response regulator GlrR
LRGLLAVLNLSLNNFPSSGAVQPDQQSLKVENLRLIQFAAPMKYGIPILSVTPEVRSASGPLNLGATSVLVVSFTAAEGACHDLQSMLGTVRHLEIQLVEQAMNREATETYSHQIVAVANRDRPRFILFLVELHASESLGRLLLRVRKFSHSVPILAAVPDGMPPEDVTRLLECGVDDFITMPLRPESVLPRVARWLGSRACGNSAVEELKAKLGLRQFVGQSPALLDVLQKMALLADCDASVLILGETGTGKEVCARSLHYLSSRAERPFVPVNCGAIPAELIENESGAFTSATGRQSGLLVDADGGTLFLDEIDTLPVSSQVKLLRFLQDKEFRPLGSGRSRRVDVRLVAASNADLEEAMRAGRFRRDLFYRVSVLSLELPPLRERRGDIPLLARHFLERYASEFRRPVRDITPGALQELAAYSWPGNVRELENVIQRAILLARGSVIDRFDLVLTQTHRPTIDQSFHSLKKQVVREFERNYLASILQQHHHNISAAARAASKNRRAFWALLRKHQLLPDKTANPPPTLHSDI